MKQHGKRIKPQQQQQLVCVRVSLAETWMESCADSHAQKHALTSQIQRSIIREYSRCWWNLLLFARCQCGVCYGSTYLSNNGSLNNPRLHYFHFTARLSPECGICRCFAPYESLIRTSVCWFTSMLPNPDKNVSSLVVWFSFAILMIWMLLVLCYDYKYILKHFGYGKKVVWRYIL